MAKEAVKTTGQGGKVNRGTRVMACKCSNAFQDEHYGVGLRVFNGMKDGWRCATCGSIKKGE